MRIPIALQQLPSVRMEQPNGKQMAYDRVPHCEIGIVQEVSPITFHSSTSKASNNKYQYTVAVSQT